MDEFFLHYLWKFQKFEGRPFRLTNGSALQVFHPGHENHDSGPDFLEARIRIDGIDWMGAVEIHHKASDWLLHQHQKDKKYDGVILHVVWVADKDIYLQDSTLLPTFQISDYQHGSLEADYRRYINQPVTIKCASFLHKIDPLTKTNMLDQALVERLSEKADRLLAPVKAHQGDWEKVTFQALASNFGFSVNNQAFETWSKSFDYSLLHRYANQPEKCFALAFGMAGFLDDPKDDYAEDLKEQFLHIKNKHRLEPQLQRHHWKFSRLRPANFPTVRMAEFVTLYIREKKLFSSILEMQKVENIFRIFEIRLPEYWKTHYDFGLPMENRINNLGRSSIDTLIINTVAPLLAAYSKYIDDLGFMERAVDFLNDLAPEKNKITREWQEVGMDPSHAADSQALIQRYKYYCIRKRCLNCNIGLAILHSR